jgi:hypothetical protein
MQKEVLKMMFSKKKEQQEETLKNSTCMHLEDAEQCTFGANIASHLRFSMTPCRLHTGRSESESGVRLNKTRPDLRRTVDDSVCVA